MIRLYVYFFHVLNRILFSMIEMHAYKSNGHKHTHSQFTHARHGNTNRKTLFEISGDGEKIINKPNQTTELWKEINGKSLD